MKLFLISQNVNDGHDTYDAAVVAAESAEDARQIHPRGYLDWDGLDSGAWSNATDVSVKEIGEAKTDTERGVIVASFNAG